MSCLVKKTTQLCLNPKRLGGEWQQVLEEAKQAVSDTQLLGLFDTLKYLFLGGRIGKAKQLLGSVLNVKPMITLKEGEVVPAGQARTRSKGVDKLVDFAQNATSIKDLSIAYNTTLDEAQTLAERVSSLFDKEQIKLAKIGPIIGVHGGPGALFISVRGEM